MRRVRAAAGAGEGNVLDMLELAIAVDPSHAHAQSLLPTAHFH